MKRYRIVHFIKLFCIVSFITLIINISHTWADERIKTIKVGFFEFPGYHEVDTSGMKSGYGYEYLHEIAKHTNWRYEYVEDDANISFEECIKMLRNGEIDLLTSVSYNEERDEYLDYSSSPIGNKSVILTVNSKNTKYSAGEYKSFDGIKIGMLKNNTSNNKLEKFSKEQGFSYTYDDSYLTTDDLSLALKDGKVEAILTSSLRLLDDERIIAEFASSPYYIAVREGNTELLNEVNKAIEKINLETPTFQRNLYYKYYQSGNSKGIAFTKEELDYIEKNPTIDIALPPLTEPVIKINGDLVSGIYPDILRKILEPSKISVNFITFNGCSEYEKYVNDKKAMVIAGIEDQKYLAETMGMRLTGTYLTFNYSTLTLIGEKYSSSSIATLANSPINREYMEKYYPAESIIFYDSIEDCIDAVRNREVTSAVLNSYIAENIVKNDLRNIFQTDSIGNHSTDLVLGVYYEAPNELYSILNKCVNSFSFDDAREIILNNTVYSKKSLSVFDYFYLHPERFIITFFAFILIIVGVLRVLRDKKLLSESAKFATLLSESIGTITELNLAEKTVVTYSLKNNMIKRNISAADYDHYRKISEEGFIHTDDLKEYNTYFNPDNLNILAESGGEKVYVYRVKTDEEEYRWRLITVKSVYNRRNKKNNLMIFSKDIDESRRAEEEKNDQLRVSLEMANHANAAKGAFLSSISHEIRTPLNAVIGYLSMARKSSDNMTKVLECINKSNIAANHLLAILNDVLDMSSIESGKMQIADDIFDCKSMISSITTVFYAQARNKGVEFDVILNNLTYEMLIGDSLRINQILMNLLSNAVKFTLSGGKITLKIKQKKIGDKDVYLRFEVCDTGIGMSQEFLDKIWEPFIQEDSSIARKFGGTGLGLSLTKNLVSLMNGTITVKSKKGEGSLFTVDIPFKHVDEEKKCSNVYDFSAISVLVVKTEKDEEDYIEAMLARCGVKNVSVCISGEAVNIVNDLKDKDEKLSLCIINWRTKDFDVAMAADDIRAASGAKIKIVVVTSFDYSDISENESAKSIDLFIQKPLFQSTLFDLIVTSHGVYKNNSMEEQLYEKKFDNIRLLLAEDNDMNMEIVVEILTSSGFQTDCAYNGAEALNMFLNSPSGTYGAVLMDIQMPEMDGYEAAERIRNSDHADAKIIPIIAMTANAFAEDVSKSLAAGMNDHISKPIDVNQLLKTIEKYIAY